MTVFTLTQGATPLLVSMPHTATGIPPELAARMTEAGRALPDTDWHIHRLYGFAGELGAIRFLLRIVAVDVAAAIRDAAVFDNL